MYEAEEIARLFLAGESEAAIVGNVVSVLEKAKRRPKWLPRLAKGYFEQFKFRRVTARS